MDTTTLLAFQIAAIKAQRDGLVTALEGLLKHCEGTNTAFYVINKTSALREAFQGQKECMQAARVALAKAKGE